MIGLTGAAIPYALLIPLTLVFACVHALVLWRTPGLLAKFLITAIWIRYLLGAFHPITFPPIAAGLSINALVSVAICGLGMLLIAKRYLLLKRLLPVYLILLVIVVSAAVNAAPTPAIGAIVKWGYFLVVMIAVIQVAEDIGPQRLLPRLLTTFVPPLALQLVTLVLGISKATGQGGAVAYIGGYFHESAFSIIVLTCLFVTAVAPTLKPALRIGLVLICVVSLILANYRTTLIAAAPIAGAFFLIFPLQMVRGRDRPLVLASAIWPVIVGLWIAVWFFQERFVDLAIVVSNSESVIQEPSMFTVEQRQLLSARPYIWSNYLYGYIEGSDLQLLFGFGTDSWTDRFLVYAHNTFISYIYEYGIAGAIALVIFWLAMAEPVRRIADPSLAMLLLSAHAGFFFLNMATMPLWLIEGLILYGLLCGSTLYLAMRSGKPASRVRPGVPAAQA